MFRLWVCLNTIQNAERQHMVILECLKIQSVAPEIRSAPNQNLNQDEHVTSTHNR